MEALPLAPDINSKVSTLPVLSFSNTVPACLGRASSILLFYCQSLLPPPIHTPFEHSCCEFPVCPHWSLAVPVPFSIKKYGSCEWRVLSSTPARFSLPFHAAFNGIRHISSAQGLCSAAFIPVSPLDLKVHCFMVNTSIGYHIHNKIFLVSEWQMQLCASPGWPIEYQYPW